MDESKAIQHLENKEYSHSSNCNEFHSYRENIASTNLIEIVCRKSQAKIILMLRHPCGNHSKNSKTILRALGGRSHLQQTDVSIAEDPLEQPREDHTKIMMAI